MLLNTSLFATLMASVLVGAIPQGLSERAPIALKHPMSEEANKMPWKTASIHGPMPTDYTEKIGKFVSLCLAAMWPFGLQPKVHMVYFPNELTQLLNVNRIYGSANCGGDGTMWYEIGYYAKYVEYTHLYSALSRRN